MRISAEEKRAILESIAKFDRDAAIYLFGSRADDTKRGGDIDLLIISDKIEKHSLFLIEEEIFNKIEEQKIDFVLSDAHLDNCFAKMVLKRGAIRL